MPAQIREATDFSKGSTVELAGGQLVEGTRADGSRRGPRSRSSDNGIDFDGTLIVKFPSGGKGSIVPQMVLVNGKSVTEKPVASFDATPNPSTKQAIVTQPVKAPVKEPHYAEFTAQVTTPKTKKIVEVNGILHVVCDVPLLFRTGDYPDKQFKMSPAEAKASHKDFHANVKSVPMPISHKPTVFDKHNTAKLCDLQIKENGKTTEFSAKALVPEWLHNFVEKDGEWGVSARWTNEEGNVKRLVHGAFVPNPRVAGAALKAAEFDRSQIEDIIAGKIVAEFERVIPTISGYATGATNKNGVTQFGKDDLPPIPEDAIDPNKITEPKRSPSLTSEADQAMPNNNAPASGVP